MTATRDVELAEEAVTSAFGKGSALSLTPVVSTDGDKQWRAEAHNAKGAIVSTHTRATKRDALKAIRAACGRLLPVKLRGAAKEEE